MVWVITIITEITIITITVIIHQLENIKMVMLKILEKMLNILKGKKDNINHIKKHKWDLNGKDNKEFLKVIYVLGNILKFVNHLIKDIVI